MARLRHAVAATLAAPLTALLPCAASAQSCHVDLPQERQEPTWRLTLAQESARFESSRYEGHYEGLLLSGGVARQRLYAGAALPAYRIVRNGLSGRGVGDLLLHSRALLLGANSASARGGLALGVTLPTGDARADLGMGHVMLMPGAWATAQVQQLLASAQISYGKALGGSSAHHHSSFGPLVAPMGLSELDSTLEASVPVYPGASGARLKAAVDGALPVLDKDAAARANLRVGMLFGDGVKTSFELELPIVGEPSTLKLVLAVSVAIR